jgi:hypothetical protein
MIFQAADIKHLSTRIDALSNVFTEGFDLAFDLSQIGQSGTMFFSEFYPGKDGWDAILWTKNKDDDPFYLNEKHFPLYFELIEDDFCKENRQETYKTPFEKFKGQILKDFPHDLLMQSPFIQTRKS